MDIIQIPTTQTPGAGLGDVVGPASATDNAIVRYDATTGRLLQNSTVTIADSTGAIAGASSLTSPAATALTLGLGTGGTALTLESSTLAATFAGAVNAGAISGTTISASTSANAITQIAAFANPNTGNACASVVYLGSNVADQLAIYAYGSNHATTPNLVKIINRTATGSLILGTNGDPVLTLASTGAVSIASTTAGSANVGALVVQGGISAGNTGSAASYFGGAATFAGAVTVSGGSALVQSGTADPFIHIKVTTDNAYNPYLHLEGYNRSFYVGVRDTGVDGLFSIASTSNLLSPLFSISAASPFTATFAGAVSITGNIGFYGQAATAKPTGVLVTAAAIHAALVTLNLIAA